MKPILILATMLADHRAFNEVCAYAHEGYMHYPQDVARRFAQGLSILNSDPNLLCEAQVGQLGDRTKVPNSIEVEIKVEHYSDCYEKIVSLKRVANSIFHAHYAFMFATEKLKPVPQPLPTGIIVKATYVPGEYDPILRPKVWYGATQPNF